MSQLPKRLARRLMDLQFLPHIVVTNPHIRRVYNAYHHAFDTLRQMPEVRHTPQNDFSPSESRCKLLHAAFLPCRKVTPWQPAICRSRPGRTTGS